MRHPPRTVRRVADTPGIVGSGAGDSVSIRLMVLTDPEPACGKPLVDVVEECLIAGANAIQLRDKAATWGLAIGSRYGEPFASREPIGLTSMRVLV